jgi:ribose transport system permease protein
VLYVYLFFSGQMKTFASDFNRDNLARAISLQSIFAIGELLVILTGGIDLSLGSLVAFSGMLLAFVMSKLLDSGMDPTQATFVGILVVLIFSGLLGTLHATLIQRLKLPPFVVTLASMSILRSGAQLLNNAVPITIERFPIISYLGNKKMYIAGTGLGLPVPTLILILVMAAVIALLVGTRTGRHIYSVGSNEEASRLSGVNVFRVRLVVYGISSLLGGLAGILYAGYGGQGDPLSGNMFELNAVSAAVIGGAVLTGGRGSVIGTVLGAALLEQILSTINLTLSNPTLWRGTVVGGVLLAAVIFNQLRILRSARRR